jgi:hypothetical protein
MERNAGRRGLALALCLFACEPGLVQAQPTPLTIEKLVTDGWEVAGYIAVGDNRSLILFKHKEHRYLAQCSVLVDVTRNPRVITYCYEVK